MFAARAGFVTFFFRGVEFGVILSANKSVRFCTTTRQQIGAPRDSDTNWKWSPFSPVRVRSQLPSGKSLFSLSLLSSSCLYPSVKLSPTNGHFVCYFSFDFSSYSSWCLLSSLSLLLWQIIAFFSLVLLSILIVRLFNHILSTYCNFHFNFAIVFNYFNDSFVHRMDSGQLSFISQNYVTTASKHWNIIMYGFKFLIALVVIAMAFASTKKSETKSAPKSSSSKSVTMKSAKGTSLATMDEGAIAFIQVRVQIYSLHHFILIFISLIFHGGSTTTVTL